MSMLKTALALALTLGLAAAPAFATTFSATQSYYTALHFSARAWGKDVTGVYAHVGVLTKASAWRGGAEFWDGVQHVRLEKAGDHYFAKALLGGSSGYEYQYATGPIVQYWVYFADGTQLVTDAALVPMARAADVTDDTDRCVAARTEQRALFDALRDDDKTESVVVDCTFTG